MVNEGEYIVFGGGWFFRCFIFLRRQDGGDCQLFRIRFFGERFFRFLQGFDIFWFFFYGFFMSLVRGLFVIRSKLMVISYFSLILRIGYGFKVIFIFQVYFLVGAVFSLFEGCMCTCVIFLILYWFIGSYYFYEIVSYLFYE